MKDGQEYPSNYKFLSQRHREVTRLERVKMWTIIKISNGKIKLTHSNKIGSALSEALDRKILNFLQFLSKNDVKQFWYLTLLKHLSLQQSSPLTIRLIRLSYFTLSQIIPGELQWLWSSHCCHVLRLSASWRYGMGTGSKTAYIPGLCLWLWLYLHCGKQLNGLAGFGHMHQ